jgi:hypothetical protein
MSKTYLSADQLSTRLPYSPRTIREQLKDTVFIEGVHYIRPFGGRKLLFIWESIESDLDKCAQTDGLAIPMANGGVCHG